MRSRVVLAATVLVAAAAAPPHGVSVAGAGAAAPRVPPPAAAPPAVDHAPLQTTWHVTSGGSDTNRGTASSPFRTIQKAADVVRPGDTILVHGGLNVGHVRIARSGTRDAPITLRGEGEGRSVVTSSLRQVPCSGNQPPTERTIATLTGADWWVVKDLVIEGGILISGDRAQRIRNQVRNRSLPGRGRSDPAAADGTLPSFGIDPAEGWVVEDNEITRRGIRAVAARGGRIEDNEIHHVECGTGGGIALANFSDKWIVRDNHVHDVEASERHFMSEGIRVSGASMYNTIEENVVEDVLGEGRGYGFDVNSGWNLVRNNVARRTEQGFSEQAGPWGNRWIGNLSEDNRRVGFSVYGVGSRRASPTDRTPAYMTIECNRSSGDPVGFGAGSIQQSTFRRNDFRTVALSENLRGYWSRVGNTWDGSAQPPPEELAPVPRCDDAATAGAAARSRARRGPAESAGRVEASGTSREGRPAAI
ncbi:MAG TPA: right-handed parallel beta-helix repeat-containing protein, partial [Gemmatimonadota bacterium]